jgi:hypothetical protein
MTYTREPSWPVLAMALSSAGLATLLAARPSAADAPDSHDRAQPCRPTITCTADIVAPGAFEFEVGGQQAHVAGQSVWSFPFLLKQSLTNWLQLQVGSNGFTTLNETDIRFLDNVFVGPKFHLANQDTLQPSVSVSGQVSIPTFAATGYDRHWDLFFVGYVSKDVGPIHVDVNGGVDMWHLDSVRAQAWVSGVLSKSLPANFTLEAEIYYFADQAPVVPHDGGLRGALTWAPLPWLVVDAGGDGGFYPSVRGYTVFAGLTMIPVVSWRVPSSESARPSKAVPTTHVRSGDTR